MTGAELQVRNGSTDGVEPEVHTKMQIMNGNADSVGPAAGHDDGYRAADRERKCR